MIRDGSVRAARIAGTNAATSAVSKSAAAAPANARLSRFYGELAPRLRTEMAKE